MTFRRSYGNGPQDQAGDSGSAYAMDQDVSVSMSANLRPAYGGHSGPDSLNLRLLGLGDIWATGQGRNNDVAASSTLFPDDPEAIPAGGREILVSLPLQMGFARRIFQGIGEGLAHHPDWDLILHDANQMAYFRRTGQRIAGYIGFITNAVVAAEADAVARQCVNVSNFLPPDPARCSVVNDDFAIGRLAARHFIDKGYQKVHYLSPLHPFLAESRWHGIQAEAAEAGVEAVQQWYDSTAQLIGLLRRCERPAAVVTQSDSFALTLLQQARHLGISVPSDLAILGIDDDELLVEATRIPLSSVRVAGRAIGRIAVEWIVAGEAVPGRRLQLPPEGIVQRLSTDSQAVADARLCKALASLNTGFRGPVEVDAVARAAGLSRRNLEHLFAQQLGTTPARWLENRRLQEAKRLLAGTGLSQEAVAAACGFASLVHFWRAFRRAEGMAPGQFRRRFRAG